MMINVSYDYDELLGELEEDIQLGTLDPYDYIQILRRETPLSNGYFPIIDWYYDVSVMTDMIREAKADALEDQAFIAQYKVDFATLERVSLHAVLQEMMDHDRLF